jgi:hypothetical protein
MAHNNEVLFKQKIAKITKAIEELNDELRFSNITHGS